MKKKTIAKLTFLLSIMFAVYLISDFRQKPNVEAQTKEELPETQIQDENEPEIKPFFLKIEKSKLKPNSILPSNLLAELQKRKTENSRLSDIELAKIGSDLIQKIGFNYDLDLAFLAEKNLKTQKKKQVVESSNGTNYFALPQTLALTNGTEKVFELFTPDESSCCCGFYYSAFPVSKIDKKTMTLIVRGKPFEIKRTKELSGSQEYVLYTDKKIQKPVRRWQIPYETSPYGISLDGTKLYIDLAYNNLLLEISELGDLKIVTKKAENIISGGKDLIRQETPKIGEILYKSGGNGLMNFKSGDKNYIVEFPYVCT